MSEILIAPDALMAVVAVIVRAAGSEQREAELVANHEQGAPTVPEGAAMR